MIRSPTARFAVFFALCLAFQIETFLIEPRQDSAAFLFMGARQEQGQMPGRDLWDNKLPLIYLIGRAAMATGRPQLFLWLLEAALTALAAIALAKTIQDAERVSLRQVGIVTGAALCIISGEPSFHAGGFQTEMYAMPLSVFAMAALLKAIAGVHRFRTAWSAGFFWIIAVSFRLPLGVAALATTALALVFIPDRFRVRFALITALGVVTGTAVILFHPLMAGYLRECIHCAVLWPLDWNGRRIPGPLIPSTAERLTDGLQDVLKLAWLHVPAIAGYVLAIQKAPRRRPWVVFVWYLAAIASSAWGWSSYAHYQYVTLAPACLGLGFLMLYVPTKRTRKVALGLLSLAAIIVGVQTVRLTIRDRSRKSDSDELRIQEFAQSRFKTEDRALLWAWGRSADLLYKINRSPGTRHFLAHAYLVMDLALFREFVDELITAPPEWIIEDDRRDQPSLTTVLHPALSDAPPDVNRLREFIHEHYVTAAKFGPFSILELRDRPR